MGATPHEGNSTKRRSIEEQKDDVEEMEATPRVIKTNKKKSGKEEEEVQVTESTSKPKRRNPRKSTKEKPSVSQPRRSRRLKFDTAAVDNDSDFEN